MKNGKVASFPLFFWHEFAVKSWKHFVAEEFQQLPTSSGPEADPAGSHGMILLTLGFWGFLAWLTVIFPTSFWCVFFSAQNAEFFPNFESRDTTWKRFQEAGAQQVFPGAFPFISPCLEFRSLYSHPGKWQIGDEWRKIMESFDYFFLWEWSFFFFCSRRLERRFCTEGGI